MRCSPLYSASLMANVLAGKLSDAIASGGQVPGPTFSLASKAKPVQLLLPTAYVASLMTIAHAGKLPDAAASGGQVLGAAPPSQ